MRITNKKINYEYSFNKKKTSRQRLRDVLNGKVPDRIPLDLGGSFCTGISAIAYNRLIDHIEFSAGRPSRMYDFNQQLAYPDIEIIDYFGIDVIDAGQGFLKEESDWKPWELNDGSKCIIPSYLNVEKRTDGTVFLKDDNGLILGKKPKESLYVDQVYWVYKDMQKIPGVLESADFQKNIWSIPMPPFHLDIFDKNYFNEFKSSLSRFYESHDLSIFLGMGCSIIEIGYFLRGFDNFLCDIYQDEKNVLRLLDKLTEGYLEFIRVVLIAAKPYIDVLFFGDDFAGEDRLFFKPDILKRVFKPFYKKMFDYVHDNSECKIFFHSCGAIFDAIPILIDAGVDILSPIQTSAAGMDAIKLKKEFGKDLIFWGGGVDTKRILPFGTEKEVREDVKRRIDIFSSSGGFVFNTIHNILADVPPKNIITMLETVQKYG